MEGRSFDDLARELAAQRSRRGLMRTGVALTLAGMLGGLGAHALRVDEADAKKRKKKKKGKCKGSASCGAGRLCVKGTCVAGQGTCPDGASICGETPFEGSCNGNPNCSCFIKEGGGERCGTKASDCGTCTTTEQCAAFGVGAVCVVPSGSGCACGVGQGFCITPCAS